MESLEQTETGPTTHSVIHAPCGDRMSPLVLFVQWDVCMPGAIRGLKSVPLESLKAQ